MGSIGAGSWCDCGLLGSCVAQSLAGGFQVALRLADAQANLVDVSIEISTTSRLSRAPWRR